MSKTNSPICVLALCTLAYGSSYMGRLNLAMAAPLFTKGGYMTVVDIGLMGGIFFIIYGIGRFVNGYVGDIFSPKKLLVGGLSLAAITNLGIGFMPPVTIILILWGINALAQSMLWGPVLRLVNDMYKESPHHRTAILILSSSIGGGSLLAIILSSILANIGLGLLFIVPGLILSVVCLSMLRLPEPESSLGKPDLMQMLALFKNKDILCMLFPALAHGIIKENLLLWTPWLFLELYNVDLASAALFLFMMPTATLLSRIIYSPIERLCGNNEKRLTILGFGFCIICLAPFFFFKLPMGLTALLLTLVMLAISMINVAFMAVYPARSPSGIKGQISMVAGLLGSAIYIGSSMGSATFGFVMDSHGYIAIIGIYVAISLISIISMLMIDIDINKTKQGGVIYVKENNPNRIR